MCSSDLLKQDRFSLKTEFAHNFGKAESADSTYKDVFHTGYLVYLDADYVLGKVAPSFAFLLCSGNKVTEDMAAEQAITLTSARNRAFSYFSPLNNFLDDSVSSSQSEIRPIVAMGTGYGLNYGLARPCTFAASDFDNLIMPSVGLKIACTEKLTLDIDGYYLISFERGVCLLNSQPRYLSGELGYEADISLDFQASEHLLISFLGGCFLPGKFYREERDDTAGSILSPYVRGDGKADPAYQIELACELKF